MKRCYLLHICLLLLLASCSRKVVVQERIVTVHDTVRIEMPAVPAKVYPEGWLGRTQRGLDSLCALPLLSESQLGLCVLDLTAGQMVYGHGERQRMRPASTMKVVTAVTAMSSVMTHPDCFCLRAWLNGNDLVVAGGMDPLLSYTDLCRLADTLRLAGVKRINSLTLDLSLRDTTRWGEGWCWDDQNEALTPYIYIGEGAARGGKGSSKAAWATAPEEPFLRGLRKALASRQISLSGGVKRSLIKQERGTPVCRIRHSFDDVLTPMMKQSDNQYAECMLWQLGLLCDESCPPISRIDDAFEALCTKLGLPVGQYRIADGSGRSLYNYVTPELLCRLLNHAALQPWFARFRASLPVMGEDGTLRKRCLGTVAAGRVQAKTGTVTGVVSLAGYAVSSEGHLLCFAVFNQGIRTGSMGREWQDALCRLLCQ